MPALARLVQLEARLEAGHKPALATVLQTADEFVGLLADAEFRKQAKSVEAPLKIPEDATRFSAIRERAKEMQEALEVVFLRSEVLREQSVRYLSF